MKTLVVTALMGLSIATANANPVNPVNPAAPAKETSAVIDKQTQAFIDDIAMIEWHIDATWQQYDLAVAAIKSKPGSVQDLQAQMNALLTYYHDDIDQGIRLQDSRNAIAEINAMYSKKIDKQAKIEAKQVARLQKLMGLEIEREENELDALVKAHAAHVNVYSEPVIRSVERKLVHAAVNLKALQASASLASR